MKFQPLLAFAFAAMSLTACSKNSDPASADTNSRAGGADTSAVAQANTSAAEVREAYENAKVDRDAAAQAVQRFGTSLFQDLQKNSSSEQNIALSPWSVESALLMTAAGAKGDTLAQMMNALGFVTFADSPASMQTSFAALNRTLLANAREYNEDGSRDDDLILEAANAIWVAEQLRKDLRPEFQETLRTVHNAEVHDAPFQSNPDRARNTINKWVNDRTDDKIPELLPAGFITPQSSMVLTNAVTFDADWMHSFNERLTKPEDFRRLDGSTVSVPMMNQRLESVGHWSGEHFVAVQLPYEGGDYAMNILVPEDGHFAHVRDNLFQQGLDALFPRADKHEIGIVQLALPKFKFRWSGELAQSLKALGMEHAFDNRADFSGMFTEGNELISQVIHEVYIDVDEEGTEAAAATAVGMMRTSAPINPPKVTTVRADRPFLFVIQDTETGTPVFMGQVVDPSVSAR